LTLAGSELFSGSEAKQVSHEFLVTRSGTSEVLVSSEGKGFEVWTMSATAGDSQNAGSLVGLGIGVGIGGLLVVLGIIVVLFVLGRKRVVTPGPPPDDATEMAEDWEANGDTEFLNPLGSMTEDPDGSDNFDSIVDEG
jgi:hypothetical protein